MYFDDRIDAARQLADALRRYRGRHPLVLAIADCDIAISRVVARALDGDARLAPLGGAPDLRERIVIVVQDGLASGESMFAALGEVARRSPARLVCAVPVASREGLARVRGMADEIVCLATPVEFGGVARFYIDFSPVDAARLASALEATRSAGALHGHEAVAR